MLNWGVDYKSRQRFIPGNGKAFIYPTTIDYPGTEKFTDLDISKYLKKHMRFIDRLDYRKVTIAGQYAFSLIAGCLKEDELDIEGNADKWKFRFDKNWKTVY